MSILSPVSMSGAGPAGTGKIRVKFLVDNEKKKVVFAESGKEFVDVLISFLTLPLGTIVWLLGKESSLGCFDEVYKSVESLDESHFQTKACKNMLLRPLNVAGELCEDLVVRIDDTKQRDFRFCSQPKCVITDTIYYSSVPDVPCRQCGEPFAVRRRWKRDREAKDDGVFVRGGMSYAITDDLLVVPADTDNLMFLLRDMGIEDIAILEEKTLELGLEEIKNLLKQILTSDQPLTDIIFNQFHESTRTYEAMDANVITENDSSSDSNAIKVKLLVAKTNQSVLHAEVGEEFCNLLFSFLTLPLGHVIKLLGGSSSISCVDNLYRSVELSLVDCINSDESRDMVISPRLPPFFACSNPLLRSDEVPPTRRLVSCCAPCIRSYSTFMFVECSHGYMDILAVNPKVPTMTTEAGGGYAKGPGKFLVTDGLGVAPFSLINALNELKGKEFSVSKLETTEFTFTQVEALNLLRAALISRDALTHACLAPKPKRRPRHH